MLRVPGKNNKSLRRKKSSKQNGKNIINKPEYKEDLNEVILNDLVPKEDRAEFNLEEKPNSKKGNNLKLNFGLGKKKNSKKSSKSNLKDEKKSSTTQKESKNDNEVAKEDNKHNKTKKKIDKKGEKPKKHTSKTRKKKIKTSSKIDDSQERSEELDLNTEEIDENEVCEDTNSNGFRGEKNITEECNINKDKKLEHIVWSEEKFPKSK